MLPEAKEPGLVHPDKRNEEERQRPDTLREESALRFGFFGNKLRDVSIIFDPVFLLVPSPLRFYAVELVLQASAERTARVQTLV